MITDNDNEGHNYILIIAPLDNYHHLPAVRLNAAIIRLRNVSFLHSTFPSVYQTPPTFRFNTRNICWKILGLLKQMAVIISTIQDMKIQELKRIPDPRMTAAQ